MSSAFFGLPAVDQAVSGLGAGALSTLLVHPLDVVRVRLQIQDGRTVDRFHRPQYHGTFDAFRTIVRMEGWHTLYQGLSPNLAGAMLSWGLYFFWYDTIKSVRQGPGRQRLSSLDYMIAAAEAGMLTTLVTNPVWLIKTRMAMQLAGHTDAYRGLVDGLRRVYAAEGVRGLYKGFIPSLFGTLHGSLQFVAYENLKLLFQSDDDRNKRLSVPQYLFMASTSKIFATCGTYPFQVIRSRLQDQRGFVRDPSQGYVGIWDMLTKMWRNEGVYGFYRGMVPSIVRVLPATCVTFVVYEHLTHFLLDGAAQLAKNQSTV